jgi:hypothetical protein
MLHITIKRAELVSARFYLLNVAAMKNTLIHLNVIIKNFLISVKPRKFSINYTVVAIFSVMVY